MSRVCLNPNGDTICRKGCMGGGQCDYATATPVPELTERELLLKARGAAIEKRDAEPEGFRGPFNACMFREHCWKSGAVSAKGALPLEPTEEMLIAARDWSYEKYGKAIGDDAARGCWKAMSAASRSTTGDSTDGYYLASYKDGCSNGIITWWGPNRAGYTPYLEQAGVYTKAEAEKIANHETVAVPVAMVAAHESRLVDKGHARNRPFWRASDLLAFVSAIGERTDG